MTSASPARGGCLNQSIPSQESPSCAATVQGANSVMILYTLSVNRATDRVRPHRPIPKLAQLALGMKSAFDTVMKNRTRAGLGVYTRKAVPFGGCFSSSFRSAFCACLWLIVLNVSGANHYISPNGSGGQNGTDWNNAWAGTAASYVRGDTYYFSTGTNNPLTLSTAASGTNTITLKAATVADHGTNSGWSDSMAGQTLFLGESSISSPYWVINGQTRGSDWRSAYGFKFWNQINEESGACIHLHSGANNITIQYCDMQGTTNIKGPNDGGGDNAIVNDAQLHDLYVGYCYLHETGNTQFQLNYGNSTNFLCEYNYIYLCHTANNNTHDEAFSLTFANSVIRYNIMQDIMWSGFICDAAGGTPVISNWEIYGNVFFWDTNYQANPGSFIGDGIVGFFGETYTGHFYFLNNTIAGITNTATQASSYNSGFYLGTVPSTASSVVIENNVWYNSEYCQDNARGDYNTYYKSDKGSDTGAHSTTSNTNPFVNVNGFNFQLTVATPPGIALQPPYNMDMLGNTRGADGVWDRGAFEFGGATSTNPPVISGLTTNVSDRSATIVWVTDKQSTSILQYGLSASYGNAVTNSTLTNSHSITISNLTANTTYHYLVMSADAAGHVGSSSDLKFTTLTSDTTLPTVSLVAPLPNAVIAGTTTLAANANDNGVVAGVQFLMDGKPAGSAITSAPYSYNWNSISVTNGTHSIQAKATDAAGNIATSTVVNVQIQNIVTNGLVGYWSFDEGSGTLAADSSGFGDTATLNTGATWTTNAVLGTSALLLNAASASSASVPDSTALEISGDLTISMWVKHNGLPTTNSWMYYLEKGQNSQENYGFGAYSDTNGTRLFFEFVDATGASRYYSQGISSLLLNTTTWRHVAVVFDHTHGQLSFYIKGQLVSTLPVAQSLTVAANPLYIGQQNIAGFEFYMDGSIDDLRIYNRALTASEINALSLVGSFMPPPPVMNN